MTAETDLSPAQCRAGRGLLRMSQQTLAEEAGVSRPVVTDFETETRNPIPQNLDAIRRALVKRGVILIPCNGEGEGVRLRKRSGSGH